MFSTSKRGNQLRLFELQSLSAEAMRIVLDKMPNSFADKIKQYCGSLWNSKQKKDLCLRIYEFFYFNNQQYLLLIKFYDFYV